MLPYSPYFHLTKFLPDGGKASFYGYVDQLVNIVKNWPLEKKAHLAFLRKQAELDKKKSGKTILMVNEL